MLKSFRCRDREPDCGRVDTGGHALPPAGQPPDLAAAGRRPARSRRCTRSTSAFPATRPTPLRDMPALAGAARGRAGAGQGRVEPAGAAGVQDPGGVVGDLPGAVRAAGRASPTWSTLDDLAAVVADRLGPAAAGGGHRRQPRPGRGPHGHAAGPVAPRSWCPRARPTPASTASPPRAPRWWSCRGPTTTRSRCRRAWRASATWSSPTRRGPATRTRPGWVIEGYATIFAEIEAQLEGPSTPDGEGVDVEVTDDGIDVRRLGDDRRGGRAAGRRRPGRGRRRLPAGGARAGRRPAARSGSSPTPPPASPPRSRRATWSRCPGPHRSIMAGLNCGLASMLALPTVTATFDAFVAVDDDRCRRRHPGLADAGHGRGRDRRRRPRRPDGRGRGAPRRAADPDHGHGPAAGHRGRHRPGQLRAHRRPPTPR